MRLPRKRNWLTPPGPNASSVPGLKGSRSDRKHHELLAAQPPITAYHWLLYGHPSIAVLSLPRAGMSHQETALRVEDEFLRREVYGGRTAAFSCMCCRRASTASAMEHALGLDRGGSWPIAAAWRTSPEPGRCSAFHPRWRPTAPEPHRGPSPMTPVYYRGHARAAAGA